MKQNLNKYISYLKILDNYLKNFFDAQKPYVFCTKGCSHCCEKGLYPLTDLEFEYIKEGFNSLEEKTKEQISENIKRIKNTYRTNEYYICPFLIDKKCSLYKYRPIICRTYGLLQFYEKEDGTKEYYIPGCAEKGLNYSSVYDEGSQTISIDKFKKLNIEIEPLSYNISLKSLLKNEQTTGMDFGKSSNLIDKFD